MRALLVVASGCVAMPLVPTDTDPLPTPMVICEDEPPPFELGPELGAPRANRSLAIDGPAQVGWNGTSLVRATSPADAHLFVPNITAYGGMQFLEDGTLIASEHLGTENVLRISPEGGVQVLAAGLRAYGLVLGPDGALWATTEPDVVYRIDAEDGTLDPAITFPDGVLPRVSDFSPAGDRLYVGTRNEEGTIWVVDLDGEHRPVGPPRIFATTPGTFHDMLVVDACGNLYVTAYYGRGFFRISADGDVVTLAELSEEDHIHGAAWGSGVGFWDDHTLYFAHPNRGSVVTRWNLGIPGRTWRDGDYTTCGSGREPCP